MTKIDFIICYNRRLADQNMLHRDAICLAVIASKFSAGQCEVTTQEVVDACGEPNAANVLRRLAAHKLLSFRRDAKRIGDVTRRAVYYKLTQNGIDTLKAIIE
jgi:hypothetical protein